MNPDEPRRTERGLDTSEFHIWAKRNGINRKKPSDMTPDQRREASRQRRIVNDQLRDLERREERQDR